MAPSFFYNVPNSILMFLFIVVLVSMSLIGLFIFTILVSRGFIRTYDDEKTNIYLATVAVVIGILIAFTISDEWQRYNTADVNSIQEANSLFLLSQTLIFLPDTDQTRLFLIQYICSIINIEFPAMQMGELPTDTVAFDSLQAAIYEYLPSSDRDDILYSKTIDLFNQAAALRQQRLQVSVRGIPNELWWIFIFGFIVIVTMTWFVKGGMLYRVIMNALVTASYAALLFLAIALDFPFRGSLALTAQPYILVLDSIPAVC